MWALPAARAIRSYACRHYARGPRTYGAPIANAIQLANNNAKHINHSPGKLIQVTILFLKSL
jgi:hypothetical protein